MIEIKNNEIIWKENDKQSSVTSIVAIMKLVVVLFLVSASVYLLNTQLNANIVTIFTSVSFELVLLIIGYLIRNRYLKPDFSTAYKLGVNYHKFKGTDPDYKKKVVALTSSIVGIIIIPIFTLLILSMIDNLNSVGLIYIGLVFYLFIFSGLVLHANRIFDIGSITSEKLIVNQSDGGNNFSVDLSVQDIDQVGIYYRPKLLFDPEKIVVSFSLDKNYYYSVQMSPNNDDVIENEIKDLHNWFENKLDIATVEFNNFKEWKEYFGQKMEVKNLI